MKKTQSAHRLSSMLCGLVLTMSALAPAAAVETPAALCPTPTKGEINLAKMKEDLHTVVMSGRRSDVLIGVDVLGRVAIGVDTNQDGMSERILLFTGKDRLKGPWSKFLKDAFVTIQRGTFLATSRQDSFGMSLAVSVADLPAMPTWATEQFRQDRGAELVQLYDSQGTVALAGLDHNSIQSWPDALWMDLLATSLPATLSGCERQCCDDGFCDSGGAGATSCSISGCPVPPTSCSVSGCGGTTPNNFACCQCMADGKANCRCKFCTCGSCP